MPNKEFLQMMKQPTIGHNGGNPKAEIWFCGLENRYRNDGYVAENKKLLTVPDYKIALTNEWRGLFGKLYNILADLGLAKNWKVPAEMFHDDAPYYSLNLYPFAFPKVKATKADNDLIKKLTGLENKTQYQYSCDLLRRETNRQLLTKNSRRIIVCCSVDFIYDYLIQFVQDEGKIGEVLIQCWKHYAENPNDNYFAVNINSDTIKTMIFCPHLARISDLECEKIANLVRENL